MEAWTLPETYLKRRTTSSFKLLSALSGRRSIYYRPLLSGLIRAVQNVHYAEIKFKYAIRIKSSTVWTHDLYTMFRYAYLAMRPDLFVDFGAIEIVFVYFFVYLSSSEMI